MVNKKKVTDKQYFTDLVSFVVNQLDDYKAEDVIVVDLEGRSDIAYYMVIASGRSSRHINSMTQNLLLDMRKEHGQNARIEGGREESQWVLLDIDGIIVHLFEPEVRSHYALEELYTLRTQQAPSQS
jgi:ribosome-associated protein